MPVVAVISGRGLYRKGFTDIGKDLHFEEDTVSTPYGALDIKRTQVGDLRLLLVSRYGTGIRDREMSRAAMAAVKSVGADAVLSTFAFHAAEPDIYPGTLLVPEQYISLGEERGPRASRMEEPFCPVLRTCLHSASDVHSIPCRGGNLLQMNSPGGYTRAELELARRLGAAGIVRNVSAEARHARKERMCYHPLCVAVGPYQKGDVYTPTQRAGFGYYSVLTVLWDALWRIEDSRDCTCRV